MEAGMELQAFFDKNAIRLDLRADSKDEVLRELIHLLDVDERTSGILFKMLKRRESLGSTGIGRGIAIPHCRSLVVNRLRIAYGRADRAVEYRAIDGKPVNNFFLIVAPPNETSNDYLPVLGKLALFARDPEVPKLLAHLQSPDELLDLLQKRAS
jgi:mannitol/fructose-specific phosphotransferase system IIA component (Ntr-type)